MSSSQTKTWDGVRSLWRWRSKVMKMNSLASNDLEICSHSKVWGIIWRSNEHKEGVVTGFELQQKLERRKKPLRWSSSVIEAIEARTWVSFPEQTRARRATLTHRSLLTLKVILYKRSTRWRLSVCNLRRTEGRSGLVLTLVVSRLVFPYPYPSLLLFSPSTPQIFKILLLCPDLFQSLRRSFWLEYSRQKGWERRALMNGGKVSQHFMRFLSCITII